MRIAGTLAALLPVGGAILAAVLLSASTEPTVRVAPMDSVGPRTMEPQTQSSVIRDYLLAWQTMDAALTQNRPDLLDAVFVGKAKEKLAETVREQKSLGIETSYLRQVARHQSCVLFARRAVDSTSGRGRIRRERA